jgi:hypothetical protein
MLVKLLAGLRSIAGLAVGVSLLVGVPIMAQSPSRVPIDVSKLGPRIGEHVPDFSLRDQTGKTWTLRSIMGPKGAVIVFFRSADW